MKRASTVILCWHMSSSFKYGTRYFRHGKHTVLSDGMVLAYLGNKSHATVKNSVNSTVNQDEVWYSLPSPILPSRSTFQVTSDVRGKNHEIFDNCLSKHAYFVNRDLVGCDSVCCLVGGYQRFGGTYCLHLQGEITLKVKAKRWYPPPRQLTASQPEDTISIFTAVRRTSQILAYFFMMLFFWVLAPCRLVGRCQRFGEIYCLHLQPWWWRQYVCSALKIETVCFSETLVSTYESTQRRCREWLCYRMDVY
jgi:hypothetical protein